MPCPYNAICVRRWSAQPARGRDASRPYAVRRGESRSAPSCASAVLRRTATGVSDLAKGPAGPCARAAMNSPRYCAAPDESGFVAVSSQRRGGGPCARYDHRLPSPVAALRPRIALPWPRERVLGWGPVAATDPVPRHPARPRFSATRPPVAARRGCADTGALYPARLSKRSASSVTHLLG